MSNLHRTCPEEYFKRLFFEKFAIEATRFGKSPKRKVYLLREWLFFVIYITTENRTNWKNDFPVVIYITTETKYKINKEIISKMLSFDTPRLNCDFLFIAMILLILSFYFHWNFSFLQQRTCHKKNLPIEEFLLTMEDTLSYLIL